MYRLIFLFLVLSLSSTAQSKGGGESYTALGFKVGAGANSLNGVGDYAKSNGLTYSNSPRFVGDVGLVIQTMFPNRFVLQGEITFGGKSMELEEISKKYDGHIQRVEAVPTLDFTCYVGTKVPLSDDARFVVGVGPYLGVNLERLTMDVEYISEWGDDEDDEEEDFDDYSMMLDRGVDEPNERYDEYYYEHKYTEVGVSIMAGFEVKSWQFAFNYGHGLTNLLYYATPIRSRSYKLSLVKFF